MKESVCKISVKKSTHYKSKIYIDNLIITLRILKTCTVSTIIELTNATLKMSNSGYRHQQHLFVNCNIAIITIINLLARSIMAE